MLKFFFGSIAGFFALIVLVSVLSVGALYITGSMKMFTADFRGKVAATEQIKADPAFRLQAYNKFFDQCASIQAAEVRVDTASNSLDNAGEVDRFERARLQSNLDGAIALRSEMAATYNADSQKSWTDAQFKAEDLPYKIALEYKKGDKKTVCTAK